MLSAAKGYGVSDSPLCLRRWRVRTNAGSAQSGDVGMLPHHRTGFFAMKQSGLQSARDSFREALQNTASAFVLSLFSHRYIISPMLERWQDGGGDIADWIPAILTTAYYTMLSLGRNYIIRRLGNRRQERQRADKCSG